MSGCPGGSGLMLDLSWVWWSDDWLSVPSIICMIRKEQSCRAELAFKYLYSYLFISQFICVKMMRVCALVCVQKTRVTVNKTMGLKHTVYSGLQVSTTGLQQPAFHHGDEIHYPWCLTLGQFQARPLGLDRNTDVFWTVNQTLRLFLPGGRNTTSPVSLSLQQLWFLLHKQSPQCVLNLTPSVTVNKV